MTYGFAVLTGANGGIGTAIARQLKADGYRLALVYNQGRDELDRFIAEAGGVNDDLFAVRCDLSDSNQVNALLDDERIAAEPIDCLVNNAGTLVRSALLDVDMADWDRVMTVNLRAPYVLTKHVAARMIPNGGGSIVNVGSAAATVAPCYLGAYGLAKAALLMFTRVAAQELGPFGIRVNAVNPGLIRTPINEESYRDPETYRSRVERAALKRAGTPEDVAGAIAFLCSDAARFITGQALVIDGGSHDSMLANVSWLSHGKSAAVSADAEVGATT